VGAGEDGLDDECRELIAVSLAEERGDGLVFVGWFDFRLL
jgi:hypothetical protein